MKNILLVFALLSSIGCPAEQLAVAAAADLNFAMKEIAQRYQQSTGNTLKLSFGSSGNFFVQIQNGAPFDLFFSADISYPAKLGQAGLAEPGTIYQYAVGKIVLWVPNNSQLDLSKGIDVLLDPSIKKIAMANATHAPYGRAAEEALKKAGIYDRVKGKLVIGENISQTAQFVQTGNAEIGIIAESLAKAPTMAAEGRFVEISSPLYSPIDQGAVVLKNSPHKTAAKAFLAFMKTVEVQQILTQYGFTIPK